MKTHWYLFDVNPSTPPAFEVAPGEEFTLEVRGAFDDVKDILTVPTPFTPACDGHPLAPIAGPVRVRGARPGDAVVVDLRIGTSPRPVMAARLIIPRLVIDAAAGG